METTQAFKAKNSDDRIPPVGTLIEKKDKIGQVRATLLVVENGFVYNDKHFDSLSSSALAAAKDLQLTSKTQNGFAFWGLTVKKEKVEGAEKPARAPSATATSGLPGIAVKIEKLLQSITLELEKPLGSAHRAEVRKQVESLVEALTDL